MTETELSRLLDSGQIKSQDFLPRFGKQLQAEFGDAAGGASNNAKSSIFGLQNSVLEFQQGIGEGVAPAATQGINLLAGAVGGLASVSKELGFGVLALSLALSGKLLMALGSVAQQFILTRAAGASFGGMMGQLSSTVINSPTVMWTAGIFAAIEAIHLLNAAVNGEIVSGFRNMADAARNAAEESRKAFEKPRTGNKKEENQRSTPKATTEIGKFIDEYLIKYSPGNYIARKLSGGKIQLKTYGELDQENINSSMEDTSTYGNEFLSGAKYRLAELKKGAGSIGKLPGIDKQLFDAEQKRQILQANIKREYSDKGLATPAGAKLSIEGQNLRIKELNDKRSEIANPFTRDIVRTDKLIDSIKSQLDTLKTPQAIQTLGEDNVQKKTDELQKNLNLLKRFKADAESAIASLRINPVLAFTKSIRDLNLAFAERQEINKFRFEGRKADISSYANEAFSKDRFANKYVGLKSAQLEQEQASIEYKNIQALVTAQDKELARPEFQNTLQRLGVSKDSSVAKIEDITSNTKDLSEGDKAVLEKLKSARDNKNRLNSARDASEGAKSKVLGANQDFELFKSDEKASDVRAKIQEQENLKAAFYKKAQLDKTITEEIAAKEIAKIQLKTLLKQRDSLNDQLINIRTMHESGTISAEEYHKRLRDLSTQLTESEKQEADARLAIQSATLQEHIKRFEFVNKQAESAIAISQSNATIGVKERLLSAGLNQPAEDRASLEQVKIDEQATVAHIAQIKVRMAQNKQLYTLNLRDARDFQQEEFTLNQELAQANGQLIDNKIAQEQKYREAVEHAIQRIQQAEANRFRSLESQLASQKTGLELYTQSLERTTKLEESRLNLAKALSDASISPLEIRKDSANRALGLAKRLKEDENLDPRVAGEIRRQLNSVRLRNQRARNTK